jgi:cytochrome b subunit of formate dehydrogenase
MVDILRKERICLMSIEQLYTIARKIHRFCVLGMIVMGMVMATTGMIMKYAPLFLRYAPFFDPRLARIIHNFLSPFFGILLFTMMVTGGYMFIHPYLVKSKYKSKMEKERTV